MALSDSERELIEDRYLPKASEHIGKLPAALVGVLREAGEDSQANLLIELRLSRVAYENTINTVHSNEYADMSDAEVAEFEDVARSQFCDLALKIKPNAVQALRERGYQAHAKEFEALIELTQCYDNAMKEVEHDAE